MHPSLKKYLVIPLFVGMTGCTAIGESLGSIQAGYDQAIRQARYNSANAGSLAHSTSNPVQVAPASNPAYGQKVYRADECIGAVVNGRCHGSIIPKGYAPTCYGTMLNGQCTGPMF